MSNFVFFIFITPFISSFLFSSYSSFSSLCFPFFFILLPFILCLICFSLLLIFFSFFPLVLLCILSFSSSFIFFFINFITPSILSSSLWRSHVLHHARLFSFTSFLFSPLLSFFFHKSTTSGFTSSSTIFSSFVSSPSFLLLLFLHLPPRCSVL